MPLSETVRLNNGNLMPLVGLGTFASEMGGECRNAVKAAILCGYRHIDGASFYENEREVGEGIKEGLRASNGEVKREDLFVTSKVWGNKMHPDDVESALRSTLRDLQLDYVDLYLVHWPHALRRGDEPMPKDKDGNLIFDETISPAMTWTGMEKLVEKGLAKNIGLSNFNSKQTQDILDMCKIKPVTNQVELHPYFPNRQLCRFSADRGVVVTAYSPLGAAHGLWARPERAKNLLRDPTLQAMADKYGKSVAQVVLRWMTQQGVATVPKSANPDRLRANIDIFDFRLSDADVDAITAFDIGPDGRFNKGRFGEDINCKHKHFPFAIEF